MEKVIILADITCDLSQELRDYFQIKDYIPGYVHFSDGRDFETSLDWNSISRDEFYKILGGTKIKVTSAPYSPEQFYLSFEKYAKEGYKIISMSISSKISTTYNNAVLAAKKLKENYPDSEIYCVDSYRMTSGLGLLVCYAAEMRNNGKSFQEIVDWLEQNKSRVHQMGPIDDLMVVARRGRLSTGKAIMGSFAGVKPMGDCNQEGYVTVLHKAKGIKKALETTVAYIAETATDIENQYVIVSQTDRELYAKTLAQRIEETLHPKKVFVSDVFDGCGTNIGPGMIGAYYLGNPVSDDLVNEKEAMSKVTGK